MSKGRRRSRRKEPSGDELVFGIIAFGMLYLFSKGISVDTIAGFLFKGLILITLVAAVVWFVRGMLELEKPIDFKIDKTKSKTSQPVRTNAHSVRTSNSKTNLIKSYAPPKEWTAKSIAQLEWRVFEKLCIRLWQEKGFSVKETEPGADGGVDFYLYAKATKQKIGAVQCKSWSKRQIDVKVMRELQGVVAAEQLKLGLLMYSGELSKAAIDFIANPAVSLKVQGNEDILEQLKKFDSVKQTQLLKEFFTEDCHVPSCPNCDVKLKERTAKKTGKKFWGCANFPKCRYTLQK